MSCHKKAIKTSEMYLINGLNFSKFLDRLGLKLSPNCPYLALNICFLKNAKSGF